MHTHAFKHAHMHVNTHTHEAEREGKKGRRIEGGKKREIFWFHIKPTDRTLYYGTKGILMFSSCDVSGN